MPTHDVEHGETDVPAVTTQSLAVRGPGPMAWNPWWLGTTLCCNFHSPSLSLPITAWHSASSAIEVCLDHTFSGTSHSTLQPRMTLPGPKLHMAFLWSSLEHISFSTMAKWQSVEKRRSYTFLLVSLSAQTSSYFSAAEILFLSQIGTTFSITFNWEHLANQPSQVSKKVNTICKIMWNELYTSCYFT